jgi:hypothetical protein
MMQLVFSIHGWEKYFFYVDFGGKSTCGRAFFYVMVVSLIGSQSFHSSLKRRRADSRKVMNSGHHTSAVRDCGKTFFFSEYLGKLLLLLVIVSLLIKEVFILLLLFPILTFLINEIVTILFFFLEPVILNFEFLKMQ